MSMSLRDQLIQAGLVSKKQIKQADHQQRQQNATKAQRKDREQASEQQKLALQQAQAAKAAKDQELNRQRQEQAERKARWAQIKQLIEDHRLPKLETEDYFSFIDRSKVRRISVDAARRERLVSGDLMIVRCEGRYDVVPAETAARIREREERAVVNLNAASATTEADDAYKEFVVPDDLIW
jgi:uncharacterized protein YaiL (DUF2058 family)